MRFRLILACFAAFCISTAAGEEPSNPAAPAKKEGFVGRVFGIFHGSSKKGKKGDPNWSRLFVSLSLEPQPLSLGDARLMKVTMTLANKSKQLVQLEFPTSQRIEVLVKTESGKLVEQWSQDQSFHNEPTLLTINPGERAEYRVEVATRDMAAGQTYVVEGFFPNYEQLRAQTKVVPVK